MSLITLNSVRHCLTFVNIVKITCPNFYDTGLKDKIDYPILGKSL